VGGKAIKGPAAKMMRELGQDVSPLTVARHLDAVLTGFVLDEIDRADADDCDLPVLVTNTLMSDMASKERLANDILVFAAELLAGQRRASADLPSF
jgi:LPPG:FO 2-phospho-L-lactate transferase